MRFLASLPAGVRVAARLGLVVPLLLCMGCVTGHYLRTPKVALPPEHLEEGISVQVDGLVKLLSGHALGVTGIVKNDSGRDLEFLVVAIPIYHKGVKVAGAIASSTGGLEAGRSWSFEAFITESISGPKFDELGKPSLTMMFREPAQ